MNAMDVRTAHQFLASAAEAMAEHIESLATCPLCGAPMGQTHDQDMPCSELIDAVHELPAAEARGNEER